MSVGDTGSLIELYVQSTRQASTSSIAAPAAATDSELDEWMSASSGDPERYHYPGRPHPYPPGISQSEPATSQAAYEEVELEKQGLWHALPFSQTKPVSNAPFLPPSPLLFAVFDEDASEPSSPGSTYEMPPSTPSSTLRKFAGCPDDDDGDEATTTMGIHHREARHLPLLCRRTASLTAAPPHLRNVFPAQGAKFAARMMPTSSRTTPTTMAATATTMSVPGAMTAMTPVAGAQYSVNGAQLGRVVVVRRRVTRSGRVKLKLPFARNAPFLSIPESVDVRSQLKRTKVATEQPSSLAKSQNYKELQRHSHERILDDRPEPDCDIPPIPLLYSGFGHFLDIVD
ncbi:hypothetical protein BJY52DRAFT_1184435 [Lactarius psammicola]|nr:hypothetical protein BJY52DRAFT_1184435 [Lactarius psammicola]